MTLLTVMENDELHRYLWNNIGFLDPKKVEAAVAMLKEHLAEDLPELQERITENRKGWLMGRRDEGPLHHGWGTWVRNLLRSKGFGERDFGIGNLDDYYPALCEMAAGFTHPYKS